MRFSIIVPVYNTETYLAECIDSVLAQTYKDWELLLIDDGSTDQSGVIADNYSCTCNKIKVIHKANAGQLFARRDGLAKASGDYILFLDSDDYWRKDCLEKLSEKIDDISPDIIMFTLIKVDDQKHEGRNIGVVSDHEQWIDKEHVYRVLLSSADYNSIYLKAFKRELFCDDMTDYSKFVGPCWGEDKVLLLHPITMAKNIYYIPDKLYYYRNNPIGTINNVNLSSIPVMISNNMFEQVYLYMKQWDMVTAQYNEAVAVYYLRNFLSAYYRMRKLCSDSEMRKKFRKYDWDAVLSKESFKYSRSRRLSLKEKLKLFAARYIGI